MKTGLACWITGFAMFFSALPLAQAETVRIAVEDDWAPYAAMNADRTAPEGFSVDVVREAFSTQGIEVEFVIVPFARCMHYALTGSAVGCFNAGKKIAEVDELHWHTTPLLREDLTVFAHRSAPEDKVGIADLEGRTVGYVISYVYGPELMENPAIHRYGVESDDRMIQMLAARRLDFIVLGEMPGHLKINRVPGAREQLKQVGVIASSDFWVAFSKKHPDGERMTAIFETGLQTLIKNGRYAELETEMRRSLGF